MKKPLLKYRYLLLLLGAIAAVSTVAWCYVSQPQPKILVDTKVVFTPSCNESKYGLYLEKGDVIRISVKVTGDPVNLYVFGDFSQTPIHIWEDVLSDNRHQYTGHRCTGCTPLCSDQTFCYEETIVENATYTFYFKTSGEHSEVHVTIAIIDHVVLTI